MEAAQPTGGTPRTIGLTGGIASGKSTVGRLLRALGAEVIDADEVARAVVEPGRPAYDAILAAFGREILLAPAPTGAVGSDSPPIDRAALAARVFADPAARATLNGITHPEIARMAVEATALVGLDIAGLDVIASDLTQSPLEQEFVILEVNAEPAVILHMDPVCQPSRPVGEAIVDHLFAKDEDSRIPVVGVTGSRGKTPVARLIAHLLRISGQYTGLACSEGVFLDGRQVETAEGTNWDAAERVLMNRSVEAAVFENSCRSILADGTVYDRCLVGVVTNVDPELHFGEFYIDSAEKVWNVFRTQVDLVLSYGLAVLNAEDPAVVEMAELSDGEVIFYGVDADAAAIATARADGKRTVYIRDGAIVLASGAKEDPVVRLDRIAMLAGGAAAQPGVLSNLLGAIAGAWALGISPAMIRAGVTPYDPKAPLRND